MGVSNHMIWFLWKKQHLNIWGFPEITPPNHPFRWDIHCKTSILGYPMLSPFMEPPPYPNTYPQGIGGSTSTRWIGAPLRWPKFTSFLKRRRPLILWPTVKWWSPRAPTFGFAPESFTRSPIWEWEEWVQSLSEILGWVGWVASYLCSPKWIKLWCVHFVKRRIVLRPRHKFCVRNR